MRQPASTPRRTRAALRAVLHGAAAWGLGLAVWPAAPGGVDAAAAAARAPGAVAPAAAPGTRLVEGRVARLESRLGDGGYPVTDVVLEPGGERFTILGGYRDGVLWVAEEEGRFTPGQRVRVRLESAPRGWRLAGGRDGVEVLEGAAGAAPAALAAPAVTPAPRVTGAEPSSGPAVADDSIAVEVTGTGFGDTQGPSGVFFQGFFERVRAPIVAWSDTRIRCLVPAPGRDGSPQVLSGAVKVWTPDGGWSDGDPWYGGAEYGVLFQYAGDSWAETRLPMVFRVNPDGFPWAGEVTRDMVVSAAEAWHAAPFSYGRFVFGGFTDQRAARDKDSTDVIGWTSPWPHNPNWIAVTWSGIDSLSGERLEADIEVNGDKPWSLDGSGDPGSYDLPTTLTHEFGHWFRLGHVQEQQHVMLAYQEKGVVRRSLQDGDRQGAAWIYPTFGTAAASTDTVYLGGEAPDTLVLAVRIADRRGRPRGGLAPGDVYAVAEWLDGEAGPVASLPAAPPGVLVLLPDSPTDADGRARIVVPGFEGRGRVRFTVVGDGRSVRERPVVFVTGAERGRPIPALALESPRPNPVVAGAVRALVRLGVPAPRLTARVLDARGRLVCVLHDAPTAAGELWLSWDPAGGGEGAGPGLYFLQVQGAGQTSTRKLIALGR